MLCNKCEVHEVAVSALSGNVVAACLRGETGCALPPKTLHSHARALRRLADALDKAAEMREREEGQP